MNLKKLFKLIKYLYKNNDYYHQIITQILIKHGYNVVTQNNIMSIYEDMPIITKNDFSKKEYITFIDNDFKKEMTSGSTGQPVRCWKNSREIMRLNCMLWRRRKNITQDVNVKNFFSMYSNYTRASCGDFFDFDETNMIKCFEKLNKIEPIWILSSMSTIKNMLILLWKRK